MKLDKIEIKSFRSIDSSTILLEHDCIGLVGINESGKTNVLDSIKVLDSDFQLKKSDLTKESETNTSIRYHFEPTSDEKAELIDLIKTFLEEKSIGCEIESCDNLEVLYVIDYNIEDNQENRNFFIKGVKLNEDAIYLKNDYGAGAYEIKSGDDTKKLKSVWVIKKDLLKEEDINVQLNLELKEIEISIKELKEELESFEEVGDETDREKVIKKEIESKEKALEHRRKNVTFDLFTKKEEIQNKIEAVNEDIGKANEKWLKKVVQGGQNGHYS